MLSNPRHERFARLYVQLGTNRHAYAQAGYASRLPTNPALSAPVDAAAARLLKNVKVQKRIAELQNMTAKRHDVTIDSLVEELDEAKSIAKSLDQPAAMTQAIMGKAKITGNIIERKETGKPGDFAEAQSSEAVLELVRSELGDDAANALSSLLSKQPKPSHDGSDTVN